MIEAVNSTVANATTLRGVVGQIDSASVSPVAASLPASGSDTVPSAAQAPFVSPYIAVDLDFNKPVLMIRDSQTGDVKQQFPTEGRMAQIASTQAQIRESMQGQSSVSYVSTPAPTSSVTSASAASVSQTAVQTVSVTTVQEVTATPASNSATSTPQVAVAALSAASSAASATESSGVTVFA